MSVLFGNGFDFFFILHGFAILRFSHEPENNFFGFVVFPAQLVAKNPFSLFGKISKI